ncbi:MAG: beta-Ala-His dipeptidase [Reinekea sp.]|nr:beta-Ala-His dipeptidase [Reinekea sp.]
MKPNHYPEQPAQIWEHFYQITQIPRPSGQEAAIREYIIGLANERQLTTQVDAAGNLVVYVPATKGYESAPTVAIQNHLDMVTVKTGETVHDFTQDALSLVVDNGWLKAQGTTLGADNGIGVAAALAVMTDDSIVHPALELLFTVEEETGLFGAVGLDASMLSATRMLNLDTEDWGEIYIGCAGGYGYEASRQVMLKLPTPGLKPWIVHLKGLSGGHSGVQIHEQLGNANKLLVEVLNEAQQLTWQMVSFRGGVAHNVIAREASAVLMLHEDDIDEWRTLLDAAKERWLSFLPEADHGLEWVFEPTEVEQPLVLGKADTTSFLSLISILPHGAQSYNLKQPADLVDLSCNLAVVKIVEGELKIQTSLRHFNDRQTTGLKQTIEHVFDAFHLAHKVILNYPGWNPDFNSALVARTQSLSAKITGHPAELKAIHAGLECGILISKKPDMDVVSFGPTIKGAHSPSERLQIDTVEPFWRLVVALLGELAAD